MIVFWCKKKLTGKQGTFNLDVEMSIRHNEFMSLYGQSGSGKTTVLRMIAGLLRPDEGVIEVNGKMWFDSSSNIHMSPQERRIGYVFQEYNLFPNMTVRDNLRYGLEKGFGRTTFETLIEIAHIGHLLARKPETLSGGEQQRIALVRALVRKPEVYLLDEPLSALDPTLRTTLQDLLAEMHTAFGMTTILVSHDLSEVFKLSDSVIVLDHGTVVRQGCPRRVLLERKVSGKCSFAGEVLHIEKSDIAFIVTIRIGNTFVPVVASQDEIQQLNIGDKVMVSSKAFNPLLVKI